MASAWVERRITTVGTSYRVKFRVGGRESVPRYAGAFRTMREARSRRDWIAGELAAMRVPDVRLVEPAAAETLRSVGDRWRESRLDVGDATRITHRTNLGRILRVLGDRPVDAIEPKHVAGFVTELHESGAARESIRKTLSTLAMILDFAGVTPNPARDKLVKLPRNERAEVQPPTAAHVLAVFELLPRVMRLALLVLDATGMRVGELAGLAWGDVDEPAGRWRVSQAVSKTRKARWVPVAPAGVFKAVVELVPREDRDLEAAVFAGFGVDRFRTAIARACKAAGVPVFSPHDLRHRRATLWHLQGVPPAEAAAWLGHSAHEHLATYAHAALVDRSELDHADMLDRVRLVHTPVHTRAAKTAV